MSVDTAASNKNPKIASDKPYATVINVTPQLAAEWLSTNDENRKIKKAHVASMVSDMTNGRWTFTGEAIQFSRDGKLLNGQHRLTAVVESGETIAFLVVRGLDDDSQRHMDVGAKRSIADVLVMHGIKDGAGVTATGRLALMWESNRLNAVNAQKPSPVELQDYIFADESLSLAAAKARYFISRGLDMPPSIIGTAYWGLLGVGNTISIIDEFFLDLAEMRTAGNGDPKKALIQRFVSRRKNLERISTPAMLSMVIRAWNADVEGKPIAKLQATSRDGKVTVPQPLVKPEV